MAATRLFTLIIFLGSCVSPSDKSLHSDQVETADFFASGVRLPHFEFVVKKVFHNESLNIPHADKEVIRLTYLNAFEWLNNYSVTITKDESGITLTEKEAINGTTATKGHYYQLQYDSGSDRFKKVELKIDKDLNAVPIGEEWTEPVVYQNTKSLSEDTWRDLLSLINNSTFNSFPGTDFSHDDGQDGHEIIIEVHLSSGNQAVYRHNPSEKVLREIQNFMIRLGTRSDSNFLTE